ncbi:MAG: hypothetical protein L6V81_05215 [Clostridium sp.]|nr:MAG: hypothetical protein L6V81_05215 [Clostridium sp.]
MNDIMYELIKANEGLIYKIASKYSKYYNIEDLYQVGSIGIIKAYKKSIEKIVMQNLVLMLINMFLVK